MRFHLLLLTLTCAAAARADDKIAMIEFFGYQGVDVEAVRRALPVHPGDDFNEHAREQIRAAVKKTLSADATDVAPVCCDDHARRYVFIGLPGKSSRPFRVNPVPTGTVRLAREMRAIFEALDREMEAAVHAGGDAPQEDDSQGYALIHYPPAQKLQLQLRDYTRAHEAHIYDVLENCPDAQQRAEAAEAIEYAQRSPKQIAALLRASRDSNADVRDEATRAIGVLLRADPSLSSQIPAADFIEMSWSGNWMDRNKASMVLDSLTLSRDPQLLARIESEAWTPLLEMALWKDMGHAYMARVILGRVRGIPEDRLASLAAGMPDAFRAALGSK